MKRRFTSAALVLALVLSACAASDSNEAGTGITTSAPDDTTTVPTTEPPTTTAAPGPDGVDAYCDLSREYEAKSDLFEDFTDPIALEPFWAQQLEGLERAVGIAPTEIRADLKTMLAVSRELGDLLDENDWEFVAILDQVDAIVDTDEATTAEARLEQFDFEVCGIPIGDASGTTAGDIDGDDSINDDAEAGQLPTEGELDLFLALMDSEAGRQLMIDQFTADGTLSADQAECFLDKADFEALFTLQSGDASTEQMVDFVEALADCDIPLDAMS